MTLSQSMFKKISKVFSNFRSDWDAFLFLQELRITHDIDHSTSDALLNWMEQLRYSHFKAREDQKTIEGLPNFRRFGSLDPSQTLFLTHDPKPVGFVDSWFLAEDDNHPLRAVGFYGDTLLRTSVVMSFANGYDAEAPYQIQVNDLYYKDPKDWATFRPLDQLLSLKGLDFMTPELISALEQEKQKLIAALKVFVETNMTPKKWMPTGLIRQ
jgi:hypothetical protein